MLDPSKLKADILEDMRVELSDEFDANFERKGFFSDKWKPRAYDNPLRLSCSWSAVPCAGPPRAKCPATACASHRRCLAQPSTMRAARLPLPPNETLLLVQIQADQRRSVEAHGSNENRQGHNHSAAPVHRRRSRHPAHYPGRYRRQPQKFNLSLTDFIRHK